MHEQTRPAKANEICPTDIMYFYRHLSTSKACPLGSKCALLHSESWFKLPSWNKYKIQCDVKLMKDPYLKVTRNRLLEAIQRDRRLK
jgi:hypothetical protein